MLQQHISMATPSLHIRQRRRRRKKFIVSLLVPLASVSNAAIPHAFTPTFNGRPMARLRGGYADGDSSSGDLDDESLDEYIDFLLAAADGTAKEEDNPLLRRLGSIWNEEAVDVDESSETETTEVSPAVDGEVKEKVESPAEESEENDDANILMEEAPETRDENVVSQEIEESPQRTTSHETSSIEVESSDDVVVAEEQVIETVHEANIVQGEKNMDTENKEDLSASVEEGFSAGASEDELLVSEQTVMVDLSSEGNREERQEHIQEEALLSTQAATVEAAAEDQSEDLAHEVDLPAEANMMHSATADASEEEQDMEITGKPGTSTDLKANETTEVQGMDENVNPEGIVGSIEDHVDESLISAPMGTDVQKQSITEISIAEQAAADSTAKATAMEEDAAMDMPPEAITPSFFLGPSAVDESPLVPEDDSAELEEVKISQEFSSSTDFDKSTHLYDLRSPLSATSEDTTITSIMNTTSRIWGQLTANILGIGKHPEQAASPDRAGVARTVEADKSSPLPKTHWGIFASRVLGIGDGSGESKSGQRSPTKAWGRLTAALLGIGTEDESPAPRIGFSRDYDQIYLKYYADYNPEPINELTTSPDIEEPEEGYENSSGVQSRVFEGMGKVWSSIKTAMNYERSKPSPFFSDKNQSLAPGGIDHSDKAEESEWTVAETNGPTFDQNKTTDKDEVDLTIEPSMEHEQEDAGDTNDDGSEADMEIAPASLVAAGNETHSELLGNVGGTDCAGSEEIATGSQKVTDLEPLAGDDCVAEEEDTIQETSLQEHHVDRIDNLNHAAMNLVIVEDHSSEDELGENVAGALSADDNSTRVDEFDDYYDEYEEEDEEEEEEEDLVVEHEVEAAPVDSIDDMKEIVAQVDGEDLNFVAKFMIAQGLKVWVLLAILALEWFRLYLSPVVDTLDWVLSMAVRSSPRMDKIKSDVISRIRGGSDAGGEESGAGAKGSRGIDTSSPLPSDDQRQEGGRPQTGRTRPNPLYRHLFSYGRLGHILIMESVLFVEWVNTYTPMVSAFCTWAIGQTFPSLLRTSRMSELPVSQTTGFVGADGSVVRGAKKKKSQTRKEDQKALNQLSRVGDVTQAKYRYLTHSFMERHGLGQFASNAPVQSETQRMGRTKSRKKPSREPVEDVESDAEWIVSALTQADDPRVENSSIEHASMSSGIDDGDHLIAPGSKSAGRRRKKRKRPSITNVAKLTSESQEKRKRSGQRLSDMDSGVMGRIRAAGANSLMGRNILGAYPGDAPPPNEAASPFGLYELAERYGYGEWSDSDEDCDGGDSAPTAKKRRRRSKRSGHDLRDVGSDSDLTEQMTSSSSSRRRRKSSKVQFGFEFGGGSSSNTAPQATQKSRRNSVEASPRRAATEITRGNRLKGVAEAGVDAIERRKATPRQRQPKPAFQKNYDRRTTFADKVSDHSKETGRKGESFVAKSALDRLKEKKDESPNDKT